MSKEILVVRCGTVPYLEALEVQRRLEALRQEEEVADVLLLLEHPPVYTRGRRSQPGELPMGTEWYEAQGIEVLDTDRGGLVTYHGPGQLVAYPIVSLAPYGDDVHGYVRGLERAMIAAMREHGVETRTIAGLTGVWTHGEASAGGRRDGAAVRTEQQRDEASDVGGPLDPSGAGAARKIGSIGLHVSRGVTTHGLAINVNNDLQPFEWVVPCGIEGVAMTSLSRELGAEQDLDAFATALASSYGAVLDRRPVEIEPSTLGLEPAGARLRATP